MQRFLLKGCQLQLYLGCDALLVKWLFCIPAVVFQTSLAASGATPSPKVRQTPDNKKRVTSAYDGLRRT